MTSIDGMVGAVRSGAGRVKARRGVVAAGAGVIALATAIAAPGAQAQQAATGFASEDGVEVQMLTGPTCTWTEVADGDRDGSTHRENVVCDSDDKKWWHAAPNIAAGPAGELTFRWDTGAQPLSVSHFNGRNDDEQPLPFAFATTVTGGSAECGNPCTITRAELSSGGYTHIVEFQSGETTSTLYAVNLEG